jgi:hypothetical protein
MNQFGRNAAKKEPPGQGSSVRTYNDEIRFEHIDCLQENRCRISPKGLTGNGPGWKQSLNTALAFFRQGFCFLDGGVPRFFGFAFSLRMGPSAMRDRYHDGFRLAW